VSIPIQALTVRQKGDLEKPKPGGDAVQLTRAQEKERREEIQGVFVIEGERAQFRKVDTGITGATDIEVLDGLKPGDQIVTGSYQVIRTLRNGTRIKIDNRAPVKSSEAS